MFISDFIETVNFHRFWGIDWFFGNVKKKKTSRRVFMENIVRIDRCHPMKLSLMFHEDGPKVVSGQCKIEETFKNLWQSHINGNAIPKMILEVNDVRVVGPLMKLFVNYPEMADTVAIKTRIPDVSRNVKTINLIYRLHVEVVIYRPRF
ncbi:MAG: hypothetical protein WCX69_05920 [Candidatus Paceibacterota bacterium]